MTWREKVAKEEPHRIGNYTLGGIKGCPADHIEAGTCEAETRGVKEGTTPEICNACWNREIPEEKEKENKPMKKTKAMLEEELDQKRAEIEDLKKELAKAEKYKQYDDTASEMKAIYDSYVNAGFNEDQAFTILMTMLQNQKAIEPVYRPSRYPADAFRK